MQCPPVLQPSSDDLVDTLKKQIIQNIEDLTDPYYVFAGNIPKYVSTQETTQLGEMITQLSDTQTQSFQAVKGYMASQKPITGVPVPDPLKKSVYLMEGTLQTEVSNMRRAPDCVGTGDVPNPQPSPFGVRSWLCYIKTREGNLPSTLCTVSRDMNIREPVYADNVFTTHLAPIRMNGVCQVTTDEIVPPTYNQGDTALPCNCKLIGNTCYAKCTCESDSEPRCYNLSFCDRESDGTSINLGICSSVGVQCPEA